MAVSDQQMELVVSPANNRTVYAYIIARDYGFAPNPFSGYCTLAACKPRIRKLAKIGDWVVGCGSNAQSSKCKNSIVYAMQVSEKLSFDEYWNDPRFENKKPIMNGSTMLKYGDNIYHHLPEATDFIQEDSHHSHPRGERNYANYKRDTQTDAVLIAEKYWYWGALAVVLPPQLNRLCQVKRNHRKFTDPDDTIIINQLEQWLGEQADSGYIGKPAKFSGVFQRYKGES